MNSENETSIDGTETIQRAEGPTVRSLRMTRWIEMLALAVGMYFIRDITGLKILIVAVYLIGEFGEVMLGRRMDALLEVMEKAGVYATADKV